MAGCRDHARGEYVGRPDVQRPRGVYRRLKISRMHHFPGGFLEALGRGVAALACLSRGVLSEKVGVRTQLAGGWSGSQPGKFYAHGSFRIVRAAVYAQTGGCMLQPRLVFGRVN